MTGPKKKRPPVCPSAASVGAANELAVCTDLLIRGMDVYKAVSPGAPYDLIVIFGGIILKVEVTTRRGGYWRSWVKKMQRREVDVVAIVDTLLSRITYMPELHYGLRAASEKQRKGQSKAPPMK
jgi:hypothetical protein